ncbi:hypothetical protein KDA_63810 [Dictyobacter alpinus]|uniref:HTH cro/C1-type domain-containing protein n=1 Tax=Dictyobacter alpinus TaxID=2014873 RepID=A0A402BI23_9CHLR|nr:hypothetical protein [Dictyobacter alpinus]GCE30897.1 hypothetical protein KDA_63810 [Dictyobacter alpinus]
MSNTHKPSGWRTFLEKVIVDPCERQRIASILGVNPVSLTRWANGTSNPRSKHLYALLDALPTRREELIALIAEEFPEFRTDIAVKEEMPAQIPPAFYARVLEDYHQLPPGIRNTTVQSMVIQQILAHLNPEQRGMVVYASQCTRPAVQGQKVRSLRIVSGRGNPPWHRMENNMRFFGLESLNGHVVQFQRPILIHEHTQKKRFYPTHYDQTAESIICCPLIRANKIAGSLTIISMQPQYFTDIHVNLVNGYVDLFMLGFESAEFYDFEQIALGIMPSTEIQGPILDQYNTRVTNILIEAARQQPPLNRPEVELQVCQAFEQEFLAMTAQPALTMSLTS